MVLPPPLSTSNFGFFNTNTAGYTPSSSSSSTSTPSSIRNNNFQRSLRSSTDPRNNFSLFTSRNRPVHCDEGQESGLPSATGSFGSFAIAPPPSNNHISGTPNTTLDTTNSSTSNCSDCNNPEHNGGNQQYSNPYAHLVDGNTPEPGSPDDPFLHLRDSFPADSLQPKGETREEQITNLFVFSPRYNSMIFSPGQVVPPVSSYLIVVYA